MAKSIGFLNMKGGVGKTTLAVNVASVLAKLKHNRVLLIDLDPQYNATQYLVNLEQRPELVNGKLPNVYDILAEGQLQTFSVLDEGDAPHNHKGSVELKEVAHNLYQDGEGGRLDLIPGTIYLITLEMSRGIENKLHNFVKKISMAYDYIIIDCPPTFSVYLLSGYLASDYYVVPVKPDPLSVLGVPLLEFVIKSYSSTYAKEIIPLGIVFTMVRDTTQMREIEAGIKSTSVAKRYIFVNKLTNSTYVAEASAEYKALFEYPKASRYGGEVIAITEEMLKLL